MSGGFQCPYCNMIMSLSSESHSVQYPSFERETGYYYFSISEQKVENSCLQIDFYKCPNCGQYTIYATGVGMAVRDVNISIRPISFAKQFPQYIPEAIRQDYEEACAIMSLSPKASATLSRRCLQGMIRDFWGITKPTLNKEIDELKDKIPTDLWSSIDALRQLGNIGARRNSSGDISRRQSR